uniref:Thrombomodulin n=1 Tax=Sinocyclocheilus grahami TaxID=75366 RepID=A0A672RBS8_SINGR
MRDITVMALALVVLRVCGENIKDGFCVDGKCFAVHLDSVSFDAAQLVCQEKGGHLMTVRSEKAADVLGGLLSGASGDFWLGLKYQCSDSNDGLKGYRWVTGDNTTHYVNWKSDLTVCSPQCVSVSQKVLKWTERACNDRIEGYLCEYDNPGYCPHICVEGAWLQAPWSCEHYCNNTEGSYHCVCFQGYIQSVEDMHKCNMLCAESKCPADCDRNNKDQCDCPDGFLLEEKFCVDIDECDSGYCDHACDNSPGGFQCSCDEGFVLLGKLQCRENFEGSGSSKPFDSFIPTSRSPTDRPVSISAGSLLGIMLCIVLCILLLVCLARCIMRRLSKINTCEL